MPISEFSTSARAASLLFILPDGSEVTLPAPSMQKIGDCLRLDPKKGAPPETQKESMIRLHRQALILFGPEHAQLTDKLTMEQCGELVQALYLAGVGVPPTQFVEYLAFLRTQRQRGVDEALADIDRLTLNLAAELRISVADAAKMPPADAMSLSAELAESTKQRAAFDAALHDKKLQ